MLLQLQQQQQWQYSNQMQTYESFSALLHDVPHGPVYASIIIAAIPFFIYLLWRKSYLRTFFMKPSVTLLSKIWYWREERKMESRVGEEYEGIAGKKTELKDIYRYGIYAGMVATGFLVLKKAFFFSLVISQSMLPTLNVDDLVLVESLTTENIEVGDIIVFTPSMEFAPVVHRVISVDDAGNIMTKGDNAGIDPWTLKPENIQGKVVTVGEKPFVVKNFGLYLSKDKYYIVGSDPFYEGIRSIIQWIHKNGPVILIVLLVIILISSFESRNKHKAMYE